MINLPKDLEEIIDKSKVTINNKGWSESYVYRIRDVSEIGDCYLKVAPNKPSSSLVPERDKLKWLSDKIPVPKIHYFNIENGYEYLLMSQVEGKDLSSRKLKRDYKHIINLLVEGLKLIHSIDITNCPFNEEIDKKLKDARIRIEKGLVREEGFESRYRSRTLKEIYEYLIANKPEEEDLVYVHGDYCFPNIVLKDREISGFIDVGRSGITDKYQDLAICARSIKHNFKNNRLVEEFFDKYGINDVDYKKLKYYLLLDELF